MNRPIAPEATIPGVVERSAVRYTGRPVLTGDGTTLTFDDLLEAARSAARSVIGAGVGRGDRVALWAPNTVEWAVASLAVLFAGASVVPINTRYTSAEAGDLVARAGCQLVLAEGSFLGRSLAREALAFAGDLLVVSLGPTELPELATWTAFTGSSAPAWSVWLPVIVIRW